MRTEQGGTRKWCPKCQQIRICAAVNPSRLGERSGQRWYREGHNDIQWFRRGLICRHCQHKWLSAEVPEDFVDELVELREALKDIKLNAEEYIGEAGKASQSLERLSRSISVLRALRIYNAQ